MGSAFKTALNKTAKPAKPAAKKAKALNLVSVSDDVRDAVDNFVAAAKAEKQAKAEKAFNEAAIIDAVKEQQDKDGFTNNFRKSYDVQGNSESVKFVSKNAASISAEDADEIKKRLKKNYDYLIEEKTSVTLKAEIFADEKKQEELMEMLGDSFAEFFDVETKLKIAADYDKNIYSIVKDQDELETVRTFIKPYKPAIRG